MHVKQSLAQTCISVCGEEKAYIQKQWEQQHIQIMSRQGGLNRIDCHVTSLLAMT